MDNLYSDTLENFQGSLTNELLAGINEIKQYFKAQNLRVLLYDSYSIAIPINLEINLPSRGSINNLIRKQEPILIKLSIDHFPNRCPIVLPDRLDFPYTKLSHLYLKKGNKPPAICLTRGDINEWFSTITLSDFLHTVEQWFYKAAIGTLSTDNNEFDPTLIYDHNGKVVYKYKTLYEIIQQSKSYIPNTSMAAIYGYYNLSANSIIEKNSIVCLFPFTILQQPQLAELLSKVEKTNNTEYKKNNTLPLVSLLIWDKDQAIENNYFTSLPTTFDDLRLFLSRRNIDLINIIKVAKESNLIFSRLISIIHAIKRPKKLVGLDGDIEFFNYVFIIENIDDQYIKPDTPIDIYSHIEPFNKHLAKDITGESRDIKYLYLGAGSLGSKMILHEGRSGNTNIIVVDNDELEHHNLARHALLSDKIFKNKATSIINELKAIYPVDINNFESIEKSIIDVDFKRIGSYNQIIDTTASQLVLNHLSSLPLPSDVVYTRCEIANEGRLGLLYTEGTQRNPRMDDLTAFTLYLATRDEELRKWRQHDMTKSQTALNIGQGCNSITTVIPDETISYHASVFNRVIYKTSENPIKNGEGLLYISLKNEESGIPIISSKNYIIPKFEIIDCNAKSGWQIRMHQNVKNGLLESCKKYAPKETGGILIGIANYKNKVIHIFSFTEETSDSLGSPTKFKRGILGLPEKVDSIKNQTGNAIGYIGEWHTHPMNLETLSSTDIETIEQLRLINKKIPIPTCAIIVTKTKIIPYAYE